jgi:hypothetical protein
MKRAIIISVVSCILTAALTVALVARAGQPALTLTPQIQVVGAAANNQSHGAWFVDLQSNSVVFCERAAKRVECTKTALP